MFLSANINLCSANLLSKYFFKTQKSFSNISNFQIENIAIENIQNLMPNSYKVDLKKKFSKIIESEKIQQDIINKKASSISFRVFDNKLEYKLGEDEKDYQIVLIENLDILNKNLQKISRKIKKYLLNINLIENITAISTENCASALISETNGLSVNVKDVEKDLKIKRSDIEWSLINIWISELKEICSQACSFLNIKIKHLMIPLGADSILGSFFSISGIMHAKELIKDSKEIGDLGGIKDARHKIIRNTIALIANLFDCVSKLILKISDVVLKLAFGLVISFLFAIIEAYVTCINLNSIIKKRKFKNKLQRYLNNKNLTKEQKNTGALNFLKNKIRINKNEALEILNMKKENLADLQSEDVKKLLEVIKRKQKIKIKKFERKVGMNIIKNIEESENFKIIKEVVDKINAKIRENLLNILSAVLQGLSIIIFLMFGISNFVLIAGIISSVIIILSFGNFFYGKLIQN